MSKIHKEKKQSDDFRISCISLKNKMYKINSITEGDQVIKSVGFYWSVLEPGFFSISEFSVHPSGFFSLLLLLLTLFKAFPPTEMFSLILNDASVLDSAFDHR